MTATKGDVYRLISLVQDDLRQSQARLIEIRSMLADGAMQREPANLIRCPRCRVQLASERILRVHLANVHGGDPVPLSREEIAA